MKCPDCHGTGIVTGLNRQGVNEKLPCIPCDGTGEVCDRCGEASEDAGQNLCLQCQDETNE